MTEKDRPTESLAKPISGRLPDEEPEKPSVSIVTAVKSKTWKMADPMANFRSQIFHHYNGRIENIYVFESRDDPAIPLIEGLQRQFAGTHDIHIVIADLADTCCQKIKNMLAGVDASSPDSKYIYFLDNSTQCLRDTLSRLVGELEPRDDCLAASGYPIDIVPATQEISAWSMVRALCVCCLLYTSDAADE